MDARAWREGGPAFITRRNPEAQLSPHLVRTESIYVPVTVLAASQLIIRLKRKSSAPSAGFSIGAPMQPRAGDFCFGCRPGDERQHRFASVADRTAVLCCADMVEQST